MLKPKWHSSIPAAVIRPPTNLMFMEPNGPGLPSAYVYVIRTVTSGMTSNLGVGILVEDYVEAPRHYQPTGVEAQQHSRDHGGELRRSRVASMRDL